MTEPSMGRTLQMHAAATNASAIADSSRPRSACGSCPTTYRPILDEVANELIDDFVASREADLVTAFNSRFPGIVISRLLGIPDDNDIDLQHCAHRLLGYPNDPVESARGQGRVHAACPPARDATPQRSRRHDLISTLATTNAEGDALSDEEIFTFVRLLFAAGTDTTFHGLGTVLYALLTHPEQLEHVVADPHTELPWAVEESLRWDPVVSMEPRRAPTATEWFGHSIDGGARVLLVSPPPTVIPPCSRRPTTTTSHAGPNRS